MLKLSIITIIICIQYGGWTADCARIALILLSMLRFLKIFPAYAQKPKNFPNQPVSLNYFLFTQPSPMWPYSRAWITADPFKEETSIIGYVEDLNPVITKEEEFEVCNAYLLLQIPSRPTISEVQNNPIRKEWLTQNTVPLPFLLVSDHLEILGVKIYEPWSKTRRAAGEELRSRIKSIRDKWRRGRFLLLRPHVFQYLA